MTQYLLTVYTREGAEPPPDGELAQIYQDVDAVNDELRGTGAWVFDGGLHLSTPPPSSGRTTATP